MGTIVNSVQLVSSAPAGAVADSKGVRPSGAASANFYCPDGKTPPSLTKATQVVASVAGSNAQVVLYCDQAMTSATVNNNKDGVVATLGSPGSNWLVLTINQTDSEDWTVMARTDKDPKGTGYTFTGGSGGGL